ncbi:25431_t:CDS:2, partial [Racocetra persica]
ENVNMLKDLQDIAKLYADQSSCIIVFVSSEGTVLRMMMRGRIRDLKEYGNMINRGKTFEVVRKIVLGAVNHNFHQAQMMKGERNHVIGKVIVQELVKNEKIHFDIFIELVNNKQIADELLQANVFSYNPESRTVIFQSRATEVFVRESRQG